jgi:peptide/nickel transport system substrate-binding protein
MTSLKKIHLLSMIGLLLASLLSACAPTPVPETSTPVATAIPAQHTEKVLNIWHPESPTILNPHLSSSLKDWQPSRIVYEPLASFDENGNLVPILATEIPSLENSEVAADGKSVTWKLREGLRWSDGQNLTADDVVFTYEFVTNPDVKSDSKSY